MRRWQGPEPPAQWALVTRCGRAPPSPALGPCVAEARGGKNEGISISEPSWGSRLHIANSITDLNAVW